MPDTAKHEPSGQPSLAAPPAESEPGRGKTRTIIIRSAWLAAALLAASLTSLYLGQDANWDLQNYHFYNPYAFINDRIDWDIAPAQLQSYHNPLLDLPFYWMVRADIRPQWIAVLLALPAGVAGFFLALSLEQLFSGLALARWRLYAALALLVGITGTAGVPLIGTTTNDWPPAMLIVISVWLLLRASQAEGAKRWWMIAFAGMLSGFAGGLKLTAALYAASLCPALLVTVRPFRFHAIGCAAAFAASATMGFLAASGFWLLRMYDRFGNPVFPYFNDWFRSPWWDLRPLESGYGPHSLTEWFVFPFRLFRYNAGVVGELAFRDWRVPLVFVGAIAVIAMLVLKRVWRTSFDGRLKVSWEWRFIVAFWFLSFLLWAALHSVYRYIIPLELFSGAMVIFLAAIGWPRKARLAVALGLTGLIIAKTVYPGSWRIPFGEHFFAVDAPNLPKDSLVLLLEDAPLAYMIPFLDPSTRFIGATNNFNDPSHDNVLARTVKSAIAQHTGPLFSLQFSKRVADAALRAYGLQRQGDGCTTVNTNMAVTTGSPQLCRLTRAGDR